MNKRNELFVFLLTASLLVSCANSKVLVGYKEGDDTIPFPGFVAFTISNTTYNDIRQPIAISFEYGHDYGNYDYSNIIEHKLEVFASADFDNLDRSKENVVIFEETLTDFLSEENRCEFGSFAFWILNIKFPKNFELNIDFSQFSFEIGKLYFRMVRSEWTDDSETEELTLYRGESVYFEISNEKITFSTNNPNE